MSFLKIHTSEGGVVSISNTLLLAGVFMMTQLAIVEVQKGTNKNYDIVACALGVGSMGGTGPIGSTLDGHCNISDGSGPDSPPG